MQTIRFSWVFVMKTEAAVLVKCAGNIQPASMIGNGFSALVVHQAT